ncbi:hypothetical protein TIFTF001_029548 [Ficus carica]|uniref:Uncharacterized protein n=1 Tax=Ficus carica TaxID=3494 RepID=A0AA88DS14_FICCA|nr:hypothetical protein TIFTF001_029548 [Ficus carica]
MTGKLVCLRIRGRNYTRVTELEPDDEYTAEDVGLGQELTGHRDDFRTWKYTGSGRGQNLKANRREEGGPLTGAPAKQQMLDGMEEQATEPLIAAHGRRCGGRRDLRTAGDETDEAEEHGSLGEQYTQLGLLYNGSEELSR